MIHTIVIFLGLFFSGSALGHPFSKEEYSLRTAIKVSDKGIVPLVSLEVPIPIALRDIGADTTDPTEVKRRKIRAYNELQWDTLAENLRFSIDGKEAQGKWRPIEHPANGKAAEGFFVYMISFQFERPPEIKVGSTIIIENTSYLDVPMVYTASSTANPPWTIVKSTSKDILGEGESADLTDPSRWSTNELLRRIEISIGKSVP